MRRRMHRHKVSHRQDVGRNRGARLGTCRLRMHGVRIYLGGGMIMDFRKIDWCEVFGYVIVLLGVVSVLFGNGSLVSRWMVVLLGLLIANLTEISDTLNGKYRD